MLSFVGAGKSFLCCGWVLLRLEWLDVSVDVVNTINLFPQCVVTQSMPIISAGSSLLPNEDHGKCHAELKIAPTTVIIRAVTRYSVH